MQKLSEPQHHITIVILWHITSIVKQQDELAAEVPKAFNEQTAGSKKKLFTSQRN